MARRAPPDQVARETIELQERLITVWTRVVREGFTLGLSQYLQPGTVPPRDRPTNEPGMIFISLIADGLDELLGKVRDYGGAVIEETFIGRSLLVRELDGQLLEILPPE